VKGWYSGTAIDSQDTLKFSVLAGVRSMNEVFPLEKVAEAYERMMSGKARFRVVLTRGNSAYSATRRSVGGQNYLMHEQAEPFFRRQPIIARAALQLPLAVAFPSVQLISGHWILLDVSQNSFFDLV
jgi:hypothetical protein